LFGTLFIGISFLSTRIGLQPDASETQSILSMLTRSLVGDGWYFYVVQIATAIILTLAANTSFSGFPRSPRSSRPTGSCRVSSRSGAIASRIRSGSSCWPFCRPPACGVPGQREWAHPALHDRRVHRVHAVAGRPRPALAPRARTRLAFSISVNALGAIATGVVAVVVTVTKFALGAWLVLA